MYAVKTCLKFHLCNSSVTGIRTRIILDLIKFISFSVIYSKCLSKCISTWMETSVALLERLVECKICTMISVKCSGPCNWLWLRRIFPRIFCRLECLFLAPLGISISISWTNLVCMLWMISKIYMCISLRIANCKYNVVDHQLIRCSSIYFIPSKSDTCRCLRLNILCQRRNCKVLIQLIFRKFSVICKSFDY